MDDHQNEGLVEGLRARIRDLERAMSQNDLSLAMVYGLPPQLCNLLGLLMSQQIVTDVMIMDCHIARTPKVALFRLRKHLDPHGIKIRSKRVVGIWLDNETKEAIRAKLRLAAGVATVIELSAPHENNKKVPEEVT